MKWLQNLLYPMEVIEGGTDEDWYLIKEVAAINFFKNLEPIALVSL